MSETRMRELRRKTRNAVGVSRDLAPGLPQVLTALEAVSEMVSIRSGRYRVVVLDKHTGQYVTALDARVTDIRERQEADERRRQRLAADELRRQEGSA